ncbi:hypothetical protein DBR17_11090 [Sphingomonas sp. HMWF008]|nr:hypothetical protein DBR17_11090 [Sphingomonas sp. HMWF008]
MIMMALAASLGVSGAVAQTAKPQADFATRLDAARTTLTVDAAGLHGPGAAVLAKALSESRYVLIGEDHLSREIPLFSTGVCRMMAPGGLDAFAVEIGPEAAVVVNAALRRPDRANRIAAFAKDHPDAFAFQNGADESAMAAECARAAGPRFQMWGLDQEFFGAPGYLFEQMLAAKPGPRARAAILTLTASDRAATAKAIQSGSPGDLFLFHMTDQQMADAAKAVARDGGRRVTELFDGLAKTRAIYRAQNSDGFASNGQRVRLMKRTLMRYLAKRPGSPRLLFKFGDVHMAKGINALGQRDVGNFVAERADGEGATALHIAVYGAKGVHALYGGVGRPARTEPFVMAEDADYAWLKDALSLRDAVGASGQWMLVDLRPLRAKPPTGMPAAWKRMSNGYDMLVVAPELTPSVLLGAQ